MSVCLSWVIQHLVVCRCEHWLVCLGARAHTHTHGVSLVVQLVKNPPAIQETPFDFWVGKIPWRKDKRLTPVFLGFPGGSVGKESSCSVGDLGSIPGWGRSSGGGHGSQLQYSGLEKSPRTEEPSGLQSMGSQRVRHN